MQRAAKREVPKQFSIGSEKVHEAAFGLVERRVSDPNLAISTLANRLNPIRREFLGNARILERLRIEAIGSRLDELKVAVKNVHAAVRAVIRGIEEIPDHAAIVHAADGQAGVFRADVGAICRDRSGVASWLDGWIPAANRAIEG